MFRVIFNNKRYIYETALIDNMRKESISIWGDIIQGNELCSIIKGSYHL